MFYFFFFVLFLFLAEESIFDCKETSESLLNEALNSDKEPNEVHISDFNFSYLIFDFVFH
jgi:hypothetical protein